MKSKDFSTKLEEPIKKKAKVIQIDLGRLETWAGNNKMRFNFAKMNTNTRPCGKTILKY